MGQSDPVDIERHEKSTWESAADIYAEAVGFMTALSGQPELATEFGEINDRSRVLDLGCGAGQLTDALARIAGEVEGVDFAENMIRVAQRAYPNLTFQIANGESLPFDEFTFDVVVCNYTAHHFARPERVLGEIKRTLKMGGRVVIIHPIQAEQASFGSFAEALYEQLPPEQLPSGPLLNVADPEEYVTLLSECGYANARCEKKLKPVEIHDIDHLLNAGWKIGSLADQPQDIQEKIRKGTIARAEKYKNSEGGYSFPDMVLVSTGQRLA